MTKNFGVEVTTVSDTDLTKLDRYTKWFQNEETAKTYQATVGVFSLSAVLIRKKG